MTQSKSIIQFRKSIWFGDSIIYLSNWISKLNIGTVLAWACIFYYKITYYIKAKKKKRRKKCGGREMSIFLSWLMVSGNNLSEKWYVSFFAIKRLLFSREKERIWNHSQVNTENNAHSYTIWSLGKCVLVCVCLCVCLCVLKAYHMSCFHSWKQWFLAEPVSYFSETWVFRKHHFFRWNQALQQIKAADAPVMCSTAPFQK